MPSLPIVEAFDIVKHVKLHGIDPWKYLVDVLHRIDTHPARDVHLLTPKLWKARFQATSSPERLLQEPRTQIHYND